ncbi:MAG TPA: 30S ribosomal protein S20 [Verrucomicrobiota bacterium]|nr:30S ribosomal protein S20 [Verrucomicrobiales bacterium]HRI15698.1 30S ribosomal protein S20 [Verrucomicrobiota bacterium]
MPNTKSAEKRARSSARKHARNHASISRLKTAERKYLGLIASGKTDEAQQAFQEVSSAYGKAVKGGAVKAGTANRKRSRLHMRLNAALSKKTA